MFMIKVAILHDGHAKDSPSFYEKVYIATDLGAVKDWVAYHKPDDDMGEEILEAARSVASGHMSKKLDVKNISYSRGIKSYTIQYMDASLSSWTMV